MAVASGIAPLAVATDGGGSTRIPAACNGVVGLKQSNGVIPHSQVQDAFGNQTYVTPMTRTVADTALMMQAMAGEDASDPWSIGIPAADFVGGAAPRGDLRGKKILFCLAPPGRKVSADVAAAFRRSLNTLEALGAELEEMPGDGFDVEPIWRAINHTAWRARFEKLAAEHGDELSETFLKQLALADEGQRCRLSAGDVRPHRRCSGACNRCCSAADMLAMPTITRTALPIEQDLFGTIEIDGEVFGDVRPNWFPWTMPFNMTGHPAVSMPCGFGARRAADRAAAGRTVSRRCGIAARLRAVRGLRRTSLGRWPDRGGGGMRDMRLALLNADAKDRMIRDAMPSARHSARKRNCA